MMKIEFSWNCISIIKNPFNNIFNFRVAKICIFRFKYHSQTYLETEFYNTHQIIGKILD